MGEMRGGKLGRKPGYMRDWLPPQGAISAKWLGGTDCAGHRSIFDCERDGGTLAGRYGTCHQGECYDDLEVSHGLHLFRRWFSFVLPRDPLQS